MKEKIYKYIFAGNSTFTVNSTKLNKRYTFKILRTKNKPNQFYCYRLYGPDNKKDYRFIGIMDISNDNPNIIPYKLYISPINDSAVNHFFQYFVWMVVGEREWLDTCEFFPSEYCPVCGRKLTTPKSVKLGIGPKCYDRLYNYH